jgi:hypothetical protein
MNLRQNFLCRIEFKTGQVQNIRQGAKYFPGWTRLPFWLDNRMERLL